MSLKIKVLIKFLLLTMVFSCFFSQVRATQAITSSAKLNSFQATNIYQTTIIEKNNYNNYLKNSLINYYIKVYSRNKELSKLINRSKPLLQYVVSQLKKRNLPLELALLPIVESGYRPCAVSNKGATGIWQISYIAGKRYGLIYRTDHDLHDYRSDLIASTNAALNYLEFLYKKFNQDWLLALAAYNLGEGRLIKNIKAYNYYYPNYHGKNPKVNYWSLFYLPKETRHYVPKLLALSIILKNPEKFGLDPNLFDLFNN